MANLASLPRVLIVDDDTNVLETFARMLKLHGHEVLTAVDADAGLSEVDNFHPDAVILDLKMPHVDGITFLRRLRSKSTHGHTPVAIITGNYLFDETVLATMRESHTEVYFKPLLVDELIAIAHRLFQRST